MHSAYRIPELLQIIAYCEKMKDIIMLSIIMCQILIMKDCLGGVVIYGYPIPEPSLWEFLWAIITLIWHLFGKYAMYWSRNMFRVYVYTNPCITLNPLLIAGIKNLKEIRTTWNALLKYELQNLPLMIFWFLFVVTSVVAQLQFFLCGHSFIQLTDRLFTPSEDP